MSRIDPLALATHLEVALSTTAPHTLRDLDNDDSALRRRATAALAWHLTDRLGCFDIAFAEWPGDSDGQQSLALD